MTTTYRTTELELASFLKARGARLLSVSPTRHLVQFEFAEPVQRHVDAYFEGAEIAARDLFAAHRSLRTLIQQVKENDRNGTNAWNKQRANK